MSQQVLCRAVGPRAELIGDDLHDRGRDRICTDGEGWQQVKPVGQVGVAALACRDAQGQRPGAAIHFGDSDGRHTLAKEDLYRFSGAQLGFLIRISKPADLG